jgi:uncharacterized membrane protein affecting hemolysin expression
MFGNSNHLTSELDSDTIRIESEKVDQILHGLVRKSLVNVFLIGTTIFRNHCFSQRRLARKRTVNEYLLLRRLLGC